MFKTVNEAEQEVLKMAGVPLIGIRFGGMKPNPKGADKFVKELEFKISEAEADVILGKVDESSEVCIAVKKSGEPCQAKSVKGSKYCMAHNKKEK